MLGAPLSRKSDWQLHLIGDKVSRIRKHRYYRVSLDDVLAIWSLEMCANVEAMNFTMDGQSYPLGWSTTQSAIELQVHL